MDLALADVVATSSDPRLGAIRLAWWRERLEELDTGKAAPAEPRLREVARELLPHGVTGTELSRLEDSWLPLLEPFSWGEAQAEGLELRGRILFEAGARLLGCETEEAQTAGAFWSLVDAALHCSDEQSRRMLFSAARTVDLPRKVPRQLRPLTVVAAVAVPALSEAESRVARGMAAVRHQLTGRFPRLS